MKGKKRAVFTKPLLLFGVSGLLLLLSTVGSTRAALTYYSDNYEMRIDISSIGVSLLENGNVISSRNYVDNQWEEQSGELLTGMLSENETLVLGKNYPEVLSVRNSGSIDSYVRVILYKSWTKDGEKMDTELSPDLIKLNLLTGNGWFEDESASTAERTVLYYSDIVPSGQETTPFSDVLKIDPSVGMKVTETRTPTAGGTRITTTFAYDGYRFNIRAEVDAVQTHNAVDAIKSAWGVDVAVENGNLRLLRGGTNEEV